MVAQSTTQGGTPRQSATGKQRHRMDTWQLDTAHTSVSFTAKHMMITKVRGAFNGVTGTIQFDEADPTASSVAVEFPAASIDTGMEPRDNHLRSADFFDAETYPTLTFTSTSIHISYTHLTLPTKRIV